MRYAEKRGMREFDPKELAKDFGSKKGYSGVRYIGDTKSIIPVIDQLTDTIFNIQERTKVFKSKVLFEDPESYFDLFGKICLDELGKLFSSEENARLFESKSEPITFRHPGDPKGKFVRNIMDFVE